MGLKRIFLALAAMLISASTICNANGQYFIGDSLNMLLEQREESFSRLQSLIEREEQALVLATTPRERFDISYRLFNLSRSYRFDIAHKYSSEAMRLAKIVGNRDLICRASAAQISTLTSGGLFVEAIDIVNKSNLNGVNLDVKREFYYNTIRLYSDLVNYAADSEFQELYRKELLRYATLLVKSSANDDFYRAYAGGYIHNVQGQYLAMAELLQRFYSERGESISAHHASIITFMLANAYSALGEGDSAAEVMSWSVMHDTDAGARENRSLKHMAQYLFERGEVEMADELINLALEDARFYNARHRNLEINSLLPIVNERKLAAANRQCTILKIFAIVISCLAFATIFWAVAATIVARKMASVKSSIEQQRATLELQNGRLSAENSTKEQHIIEAIFKKRGQLMHVENLLKRVDARVKSKQFDELKYLYKDFNIKHERAEFFREFDDTFLRLFPNFIREFNALLRPDSQIAVGKDGATELPMELRIFALMRLGVGETEDIAQFFDLSVSTIYTYKTKVKSRSVVDREDFEARVMSIDLSILG